MRRLGAFLGIALVAAWISPAAAGDARVRRERARTDLFVDLPLDYSTRVIFPFGGTHHAVPGVVSVNQPSYRCAPHARTFRSRVDFVVHLRAAHGLDDEEIPAAVVVDRGRVVYVGE
jgi:hypothetical protein